MAAMRLGAGRERKEDKVDPVAGLLALKKTGDFVRQGEPVALLYASSPSFFPEAEQVYLDALSFSATKPERPPLVMGYISEEKTAYY